MNAARMQLVGAVALVHNYEKIMYILWQDTRRRLCLFTQTKEGTLRSRHKTSKISRHESVEKKSQAHNGA